MVVINRLIFSWSGQHLDVYIVSNGLPNKYFDQMPAKHQPSNFSCTAEVIEQSNYRLENYIHSLDTEKLIKGCKRINEKNVQHCIIFSSLYSVNPGTFDS